MQKHVNVVDLVKSFPTNIYLQNLASIQKKTSPVKFAHLAEKSGKGSMTNLSTKVLHLVRFRPARSRHSCSRVGIATSRSTRGVTMVGARVSTRLSPYTA